MINHKITDKIFDEYAKSGDICDYLIDKNRFWQMVNEISSKHDRHIIGRLEDHKNDYKQELDNPDSRKSSEYINGVVIGLGIAISEIEESGGNNG